MWGFWIFIALIGSPVVLIVLVQIVKAKQEENQRAYESAQAAKQEAEKRQANARKAEAAEHEAKRKAAAAAFRKEEQRKRKEEQEAEQRRKRAERLAAARELAEYRERALQAEKELKALQTGAKQADHAGDDAGKSISAKQPVNSLPEVNAEKSFPQMFAGETVAFTGTLPTMTRAEAIKAVQERGGRAYETVHTDCTLLVVGQRPGRQQTERATSWHIRTITWQEWFAKAEISYTRRMYAQALAREAKKGAA